jgi:hypothetical protein
MESEAGIRFSTIEMHDDYTVKKLSMDELVAALEFARARRWGASWSSIDALRAEVDPASPKLLLPAMRNAAGDTEVESLRCHLWYLPRQGPRLGRATLFDVELSLRSISHHMGVVVEGFAVPGELSTWRSIRTPSRLFLGARPDGGPVRLPNDQAGSHGQMGRKPPRVINLATSHQQTHAEDPTGEGPGGAGSRVDVWHGGRR